VLCYGFFFIPPSFTFLFTNVQYIFTSLVMLLVAQVISHLTIITRRQAESAHQAEMRTATLHLLSQQLASTRGVDKLLETAVQYISDIFNSGVLALLSEDGHLEIKAGYKIELLLSPKERGVAQWVADLGQVAGLGTDTLPSSNALYVPLLTAQGTIGVLRVQPMQLKKLFTPEQRHLLEACANQIALAIEVDRLQEQAKISELQSATDQVRNTLMTYLEAEDISLHKELCSIAEQVHNTVKSLHKLLEKKQVILNCSADVPPISFDKILINEVLKNLIDNALKFTPADSIIHISVSVEKNALVVSVEDNGPGIVPDEMNKLFEKFYRGKMLTPQSGLGLGLAICHRIIHAHGGKIWAENRDQGGAAFRFSLPFG
jgi:two-component system sensor histidine kinase KdpD